MAQRDRIYKLKERPPYYFQFKSHFSIGQPFQMDRRSERKRNKKKTGIDPETERKRELWNGKRGEREKKSNLICMLPENPDRAECSLSARSNGREEDVIFKRGGGGWPILPPSQMENVAVEKEKKKAINTTLCM